MNKEMFWQLIDESREACKDNLKGMAKYLEGRLSGLSLDEAKSFCGIFDTYHRAANKDGIASIGQLMNHEMMSDDGFTDFRNWLMSNGKKMYLETLKNPETLAMNAGEPIDGWYEFETLGYVGTHVVERMTGDFKQSFVQLSDEELKDILDEIEYGEYADKKLTLDDIKTQFPSFAERFIKANDLPKIRLHDLRHSNATALIQAGVNPRVVQQRLGHSDVNITLNTYTHVLPEMDMEAAEKLDAIMLR